MKNLKKSLKIFLLGIAIFVSCRQENLKPNRLQMNSAPQNSEKFYKLNGTNNLVSESDLAFLGEDIDIINDLDGNNYVFNSENELRNWANNQRASIKNTIINKLDSIRTLQNFAIERGLLNDLEATEKFFTENYGNPNEFAPSVGVSLLFDGGNCGGKRIGLAIPWMPSLFWMNNRTSSFVLLGNKVFCDRTWFRGPRWWWWGTPYCISIQGTIQDNRYESAM